VFPCCSPLRKIASQHTSYAVRDLWLRANLSATPTVGKLTLSVPTHGVRLLRMWPLPPPPPPPPRPPPPPPTPLPAGCPSGYTKHASGYWKNLNPCSTCAPAPLPAGAPLVECGKRCDTTPNCVAFELFHDGAVRCYTFEKALSPPFTSEPEGVMRTCVVKDFLDTVSPR